LGKSRDRLPEPGKRRFPSAFEKLDSRQLLQGIVAEQAVGKLDQKCFQGFRRGCKIAGLGGQGRRVSQSLGLWDSSTRPAQTRAAPSE
jgi:hypothetical protein